MTENDEPTRRFEVHLNENLFETLKALAVSTNTTMRMLITDIVKTSLPAYIQSFLDNDDIIDPKWKRFFAEVLVEMEKPKTTEEDDENEPNNQNR